MKLVLCSEGFHTENTVQAAVKLCGKPQNEVKVAIINEAHAVQPGDKRWVIENLSSVSRQFPAELDIINLLALSLNEISKRIEGSDMIFVVGGNPDFLMHTFNETGFTKLLPEVLKEKVYVGSSAGSMIMGHRLATETIQNIYDEEPYGQVSEYLGLVDLAILPHMESKGFPNATSENITTKAIKTNHSIYGLCDDSAIVVNGTDQEVIGSSPLEIKPV